MLESAKEKLSSRFNLNLVNTIFTIIPVGLIYYYSFIYPNIGLLSTSWQSILPFAVSTATFIGGYGYINSFYNKVITLGNNFWQYIWHKKTLTLPELDMSELVSLSLISNIAYGLILGSTAPIMIYTAPLITLAALNLSEYFKNIVNTKRRQIANQQLHSIKARLPSLKDFNQIIEGQKITVKPGHLIPVDGYLISKVAKIQDGTMVTGENNSTAVYTQNQLLKAGTVNVSNTEIELLSKTAGIKSSIYKLLQNMSLEINRAPTATIIDSISKIFVPIVLTVATLTFGFWTLKVDAAYGLKAMMDVLFAACPCALGFANTIPYGILKGKLFANNIYINQDSIIETFQNADTLVFDKTGTLTTTKLTSINKLSGKEIDYSTILELQRIRISTRNHERASDPYANEIINYLTSRSVKINQNQKIELIHNQHNGISANIVDTTSGQLLKTIHMGSKQYIQTKNQLFNVNSIESTNHATIFIAEESNSEHQIQASINFNQALRQDAAETIKKAKEQGYNVIMLTGDSEKNAENIAKQLGINNYVANCTPSQKAEQINKLITKYNLKVIMVGDGLNDIESTLVPGVIGSVAMGIQSIMSACSHLTLERLSDLLKLKPLFTSAKNTQNQVLGFSLTYNTISIILAAMVFPSTGMVAMTSCFGICMALSSSIAMVWSCTLIPKLNTIFNKFKQPNKDKLMSYDSNQQLSIQGVANPTTQLRDITRNTAHAGNDSKPNDDSIERYYFSIVIKTPCKGCIPKLDALMKELKSTLNLDNYLIDVDSAQNNEYPISFFADTHDPESISKQFTKIFKDNARTIHVPASFEKIGLPISLTSIRP